jgi:hypothetical protein
MEMSVLPLRKFSLLGRGVIDSKRQETSINIAHLENKKAPHSDATNSDDSF